MVFSMEVKIVWDLFSIDDLGDQVLIHVVEYGDDVACTSAVRALKACCIQAGPGCSSGEVVPARGVEQVAASYAAHAITVPEPVEADVAGVVVAVVEHNILSRRRCRRRRRRGCRSPPRSRIKVIIDILHDLGEFRTTSMSYESVNESRKDLLVGRDFRRTASTSGAKGDEVQERAKSTSQLWGLRAVAESQEGFADDGADLSQYPR